MLVFSILFVATQAFGLIHEYDFAWKGYFNIDALLFIFYGVGISLSLFHIGELRKSLFIVPFMIILLLLFFGIFYPWFMGFSSLYYSIKQSKEFMNYLCYFSMFCAIRRESDLRLSWYVMVVFAIYFALLEVLGNVSGGEIAELLQYNYRKDEMAMIKIYIPIFTLMIPILFYYFYKFLAYRNRLVSSTIMLLMFIGILLTFFRAYILAVVVTIPVLLIITNKLTKSLIAIVVMLPVLVISVFVVYDLNAKNDESLVHSFIDRYEQTFDVFFSSGVRELYRYEGGALIGRNRVAIGLKELVSHRPLLGLGFLDVESELGRKVRTTIGYQGTSEIGFVDKGYLDVMAKFGLVGGVLLYGSILYAFFRLVRICRADIDGETQAQAFAAAGLIMVFLISQLTHANLTRQFGILPLALLLGLVDRRYTFFSKPCVRQECVPSATVPS
ncbi:MAG: hypothetical protein FD174_1640 [Geobacteraceae bacterium]|nr:MAG: hypothetical protein FD174_1640 [Geobacteraceae bacterium]